MASSDLMAVANPAWPWASVDSIERMVDFGLDEVSALRLNADLVVLSACESGLGRLHEGEGVRGLAQAFLQAGSRGVLCSLWSVADAPTSSLMAGTYAQLKAGRSAAVVRSRRPRRSQIAAGQPPLYWAPFILIGE